MTQATSVKDLGHLIQFLRQTGRSMKSSIEPQPHGLVAVVADVFPPVVGMVVPEWNVQLNRHTPVALTRDALKAMESEHELGRNHAVWGSAHLGLVATFIDYRNPVLIVTGRDDKPPTWKNCLGTLGGYSDTLADLIEQIPTALREGAEECVITIPDPQGSGERVAITWGSEPGEDFGREARESIGLGQLPRLAIPMEPMLRVGDEVVYTYGKSTLHRVRGLIPVYDEVNRRYDCVYLQRTHFPCRIADCHLWQAEVRPDGQILNRPVGWFDLVDQRIAMGWQGGEQTEYFTHHSIQMTPTLQGAVRKLHQYYHSLVLAET